MEFQSQAPAAGLSASSISFSQHHHHHPQQHHQHLLPPLYQHHRPSLSYIIPHHEGTVIELDLLRHNRNRRPTIASLPHQRSNEEERVQRPSSSSSSREEKKHKDLHLRRFSSPFFVGLPTTTSEIASDNKVDSDKKSPSPLLSSRSSSRDQQRTESKSRRTICHHKKGVDEADGAGGGRDSPSSLRFVLPTYFLVLVLHLLAWVEEENLFRGETVTFTFDTVSSFDLDLGQ